MFSCVTWRVTGGSGGRSSGGGETKKKFCSIEASACHDAPGQEKSDLFLRHGHCLNEVECVFFLGAKNSRMRGAVGGMEKFFRWATRFWLLSCNF